MADGEAIVGLVQDVVDGDDERQQPGQDGEDLVGDDGIGAVGLPLGEGVDCWFASDISMLRGGGGGISEGVEREEGELHTAMEAIHGGLSEGKAQRSGNDVLFLS